MGPSAEGRKAPIPLVSEPGEKFLDSNLGFETLGRVIEVVSGKSYEGMFVFYQMMQKTDLTKGVTERARLVVGEVQQSAGQFDHVSLRSGIR